MTHTHTHFQVLVRTCKWHNVRVWVSGSTFVEVDASDIGVGAVLSLFLLSPVSRRKEQWSRGQELLAVKVVEDWWHLLEGAEQPFCICTDHKNLTYIRTAKRLNARQHIGLYSSPGLTFLSLTVQAPSVSSPMRCPVSSPPTPNHWKFQPFSLLAAKLETSPGRWRRPSARHWGLTRHSYRPALRPSSCLLQISRLDSYDLVFRLHGERQDQCSDYTCFWWETLDRDVREFSVRLNLILNTRLSCYNH